MIKWFKRIKLEMSDNSYSDTTNEVKSINRRKRRVAMSDSSDSDADSKKKYSVSVSSSSSSLLFQPETPLQKAKQPCESSEIASSASEQKLKHSVVSFDPGTSAQK